ncbi:MAG: DNA polymerase III subunit gamma/tau [Desulfobacteraceae bacterium]|nr:MAG: DNA polymerase III subunit gamma/tau [Desulfobacteraceae bacterium]
MVYEVLARKWRPQIFQDVVGQEHITQTLMNAVKEDRIAHAYLFGGARGVGKTSVARVFAKAINCRNGEPGTPCNTCPSCLGITGGSAMDVQEIDGASNRGIEEIRELRENIKYMPTAGRYRVYIIDEVHMLTLPAFNALLKTLEEPPAHVKFIFATTDPHKVPVTILSRCQRFDFKRIPPQNLVLQLEKISVREGFEISKTGLAIIAAKAEGSMRDAESLLDQVISFTGRKVEDADIADILGIMDRELISETSLAVIQGSGPKCLEIVDRIYNYGYDTREFYRSLMEQFRNLAVSLIDPENRTLEMSDSDRRELRRQAEMAGLERLQQYLNLLIAREEDLRTTSHPRLVLETILIRLSRLGHLLSFEDVLKKLEILEKRLTRSSVAWKEERGPSELSESPAGYSPSQSAPAHHGKGDWEGFLEFVSAKGTPLANVLKNWCLVSLQSDIVELARGGNSFSASYLDEPERKKRLIEYCNEYFGKEMQIRIVAGEKSSPPLKPVEKNGPKAVVDLPGPIQDVLEIFKGEVQGDLHGKEKK